MSRYSVVACLALAVFSTGCASVYRPYEPLAHVDGWDPVLGSCSTCGSCGGTCEGHTPASYARHMLTCGSGCGGLYWGDWLSAPPEHGKGCDPCTNHGDWVGVPSGKPKFWHVLAGSWHGYFGHRLDCGGCAGCGGGEVPPWTPGKGTVIDYGETILGEPVGQHEPLEPVHAASAAAGPPMPSLLRSTRFTR